MKLAVTNPYSWPEVRRGAERIIVETARCMAARGHKVTIFTAGERWERRREGKVTTVKLRRRFEDPSQHERWFGRRIAPLLLMGRFDAVHSMMPYDALAAVRTRRFAGHRSVYEELGSPIRDFWETLSDGDVRTQLVQEVDVYGCMSNFSLDILKSEWGRNGDLIPGGVRLSEFTPSSSRDPRPTVLFSGALSEIRKGLGLLLAAADLLMERHPDLQLWLSGPGDPDPILAGATPRVRAQATLLPLGDPRELANRYADAWVTALPSVGDSFGMVLIESLASGTPIVVSDDSAPPQLVTPKTGIISRPNDARALAKAIEAGFELAADPSTQDHCREFARQFDWDESIGPLLEKLYRGTP
ncbi:MAG TPA: glycosyltransferase family 4 protein [Acidimicrobiales bacterium]